jgi:cytochrome c peroxidase
MLRSLILLAITFTLPMFRAQQDEPDAEVQLGKKLFFDPILSRNKTLSCAGCHRPEFGFADTLALSKGEAGKSGRRNTPSILNLSDRPYFFFDGRAASLEEQILGPIQDSLEMNLPVSEAVRRLREDKDYLLLFNKVYRQAPDSANLGKAIAAYERTLETYPTAWDLHAKGKKQMSASAQRGHKIFNQKGKCFDCHFGPDFTGDEFRNIGLYNEKNLNDRGRATITGKEEDAGKFKVPGLRNVSKTAPYMHNGMFRTLREVIDYYDNPNKFVSDAINRDTLLARPLGLSERDKQDLEAFLRALDAQ